MNEIEITEAPPFGSEQPNARIYVTSEPSADAIADDCPEPFEWMNLRDVPDRFDRLLDADEVVLAAAEAEVVLDYPLGVIAVRRIAATDGNGFTRGELVRAIDAMYRDVYTVETKTQSQPTLPRGERKGLLNRPPSDGEFGIAHHDLDDLGVSSIVVYQVGERIWLWPDMVS